MTDRTFEIRVARWPQDAALIKSIRRKVFVIEQGLEPEIEWDGKDASATHVLASVDGEYIGTGRIQASGHLGRLSVISSYRGLGIGKAMISHLLEIARAQKHELAYLNAQVHAVSFYEQFGFVVIGKVFMVAGIPHQRMELDLSHEVDDSENLLSQTSIHGLEDNYQALLELCYLARHSIDIFTTDLDRRLLSRSSFIQTLKGFIRISPKSRLRILVTDPSMAIRYDHQLIEFSQEFSTFVQIKRTHEEYRHLPYSYVLIDGKACLYRPHADQYESILTMDNAAEGRQRQAEFMEIWDLSDVVPGIKRLFI